MPNYLSAAMRLARGLGKLYPEGSAGFEAATGAPKVVALPGIGRMQARPIQPLEEVANSYVAKRGMAPRREGFTPINPEFSSRVADAYGAMKHDPENPEVKRAYDALIEETMDQLRAAEPLGIKYNFTADPEAHKFPSLGYADLLNKREMAVYPTESGFGTSGDIKNNPLLKPVGRIGNNPNAVANDAFRIVHDLYGHYGPGNAHFRAPGEERAFQLHSQMYSPEALPAAASETRGQNSFVNFGPNAELNRNASSADTFYADQKSGIMPAWASALPPAEGADVDAYIKSLGGKAKGGRAELGAGGDAVKAAMKILSRSEGPLAQAARGLGEGVSREGYQDLVNTIKPVRPYESVPTPATTEEMINALHSNKRGKVGLGREIEEGYPVGLRLDIPAYTEHNVWVPTVHDTANNNRVLAHEAATRVMNPVFSIPENKALAVAQGKPKAPFATINGAWAQTTPEEAHKLATEALGHPDWRQVGMDPERHSYFYDRHTQEPITHADEAVQVGPLVLAKNPVYGNREDFKYADGGRAKLGGGGDAIAAALRLARMSRGARPGHIEQAFGKAADLGDQRMLVTHSLRPGQLKGMHEYGWNAIPSPSLAISKPATLIPDQDMDMFGGIRLIGKQHLAEPSASNPVFSADAYTARVPKIISQQEGPGGARTHLIETGHDAEKGLPIYDTATPENISREMAKRPLIGGEWFNPTPKTGTIYANLKPRFNTLEEIKEARPNLISSDIAPNYQGYLNEEQYSLGRALDPHKTALAMEAEERLGHAMLDRAKTGGENWNNFYRNVPDNLMQRYAQHEQNIVDSPVHYFEAKPQRPVNFNEFAGAMVPKNEMDVSPFLQQLGINNVVPYDRKSVDDFYGQLNQHFGEHMFAKGGNVESAMRLASGGGAWTREEGKNPEGGLNDKGRASLKAQGHDIKRPQPEGGARRDSFCARMKGMKAKLTSKETASDPDSRINKSLRAWNCKASGGQVDRAMRTINRMNRDDGGRASQFVQQQLFSGEPQVPQTNRPLEQATERWAGRALDAAKGAAYLYPPTRGAMGIYDAAHGLATGNPYEMASSVFALPGKAMKAIGAAGLSQQPEGEGANPKGKLIRAAYGESYARGGYATDGAVEGDVSYAPESPDFNDSGSMMANYAENAPQSSAHDFVQQQLAYGEPQLPQKDVEAEQAWKDVGTGAAHMGAYFTPLAPAVQAYDAYNAARDIAANPRDPMAWGTGALTAAFPAGGKAAKYLLGAGLAAGAMAPGEAEAGKLDPAFKIARQFIKNPTRVTRPDIYSMSPSTIADIAESRVAPESPALKRLFGVTRGEMNEIAGARPGTAEPLIATKPNARGSEAAENIMTNKNAQRLVDILGEANKRPRLSEGMRPWYYMDPAYNRMAELIGPEAAEKEYHRLNTTLGVFSPGSPVTSEINRGAGAYYAGTPGNNMVNLQDFVKYGGDPSSAPATFRSALYGLQGHPYHSTSHGLPLMKYYSTGEHGMQSPKVPLYIQASGSPSSFQTKLPVPDAHFTRLVGLPDTRGGASKASYDASMRMPEFQSVGPWWSDKVAKKAGMEAVPAQALAWGAGSHLTGVDTPIGSPKLEMLANHIMNRANQNGIDPEKMRDLFLTGQAYKRGGRVKDALRLARKISSKD